MLAKNGTSCCSCFRPVRVQRRLPWALHRTRTAGYNAVKQDLLHWATDTNPLYEQLPVAIEGGEYGRCLVAQRDIEADEVVLSVCMDRVFSSQAADQLEIHWAADMAVRLLQARHACRTVAHAEQHSTSDTTSSSSTSADDSSVNSISSSSYWKPWIDSLPERSVTPVEFTDEEVQQLVFPNAVEAVLNMRTCLEDCFEYLQPELEKIDCSWTDFLWAVQVLHSRCFFESSEGGRHLAVPGIDMCNHSSTAANAAVRVIHSPGACQGLGALEEVVAAAAGGGGDGSSLGSLTKSYFQLVAGSEGIAAGEQVYISYGSWPSEPFLLLFGFVPQPNPNDAIILFDSLQHMAACYVDCLIEKLAEEHQSWGYANMHDGFKQEFLQHVADREQQQQQQKQRQQEEQEEDLQSGPNPGYRFMFVKANEMDGRLHGAMQVLYDAAAAAAAVSNASGGGSSSNAAAGVVAVQQLQQQVKIGDVIAYRLRQLIQQLDQVIPRLQQQQQQRQQQQHQCNSPEQLAALNSTGEQEDGRADQLYHASVDHTNLILAYCSSKAALAKQLLSTYSDPISMIIAAGASRR